MSDEKDGQKAKKTYVLDTNVLVHDPECIFKFEEHDIVLPLACIEEFDAFKRERTERGAGAREAVRRIEKLRTQARDAGSSLNKGVRIDENNQGMFYVFSEYITKSALGLPLKGPQTVDNLCLEITKKLREEQKDAVLVTKDINLRIKADGFDIPCEDYLHDKKGHSLDYLFKAGRIGEVYVSPEFLAEMYQMGMGEAVELQDAEMPEELFLNQGVIIRSAADPKQTMLARYIGNNAVRRLLYDGKKAISSIRPQNFEQKFAFDALLAPELRVVAMLGKAGTGKTLMSLAAGTYLAVTDNKHRKMVVVRPSTVLGKELGYLPGALAEKQDPFMAPIYDNLALIFDYGKDSERWDEESYKEPIRTGHIELMTPGFLRGRSIPNVYLVVDETQNLTPHEVKTIITRPSQKSKIVLVGDPWQIDNPYIDEESNGLTTLVRAAMGKKSYFAVEFLNKSERDDITDDLADLL